MTVYNVNLGIGWASSGVEYAQAYRSQVFKKLKIPAKFIFSDLILANNIEDLTHNLGFDDDQIIWLYNFFTDIKIAPTTYTTDQLEKSLSLSARHFEKKVSDKEVQYYLNDEGLALVARFNNKKSQTIDQLSYVVKGQLVQRDFFSYVKYASEYYLGTAKNNHVTYRKFFNEDGTVAYIQHLAGQQEIFEFSDRQLVYSKNELYRQMLQMLAFHSEDTIILDRLDEDKKLINSQLIFENHRPAKLMVVVHADHYDKHFTNRHHILWNNFYEYQFIHPDDVTSYVVATDKQRELLIKQEKHFQHAKVRVDTIPVGSLPELKQAQQRKRHALITASRLATEKHLDWLIRATVLAHEKITDVSLDIYGQGAQYQRLNDLIKTLHAEDYIRLMGQHDLTDVYIKYAAYASASTSEGFGLSLLEAVGSGLPMIGFDVPYGNQTFIENEKNGYLLSYQEDWDNDRKIQVLAQAIISLFNKQSLEDFSNYSYKLAEPYLTTNVAQRWQRVLEEIQHD